jgi:hypothetical protein
MFKQALEDIKNRQKLRPSIEKGKEKKIRDFSPTIETITRKYCKGR